MLADILRFPTEVIIGKQPKIIQSILDSDYKGIRAALEEDPTCVNDKHNPSNMSAPMLATFGGMPDALEMILEHGGQYIDYRHKDDFQGDDLLSLGFGAPDERMIVMITAALQEHVPHLVNNYDAYFAEDYEFPENPDESTPS